MKKFIVAGIDTEIGKTVISSILVEALEADYWKPVQSGDLHNTDTDKVKALISNQKSVFHPEAYRLNAPMSPHAAAARDNVKIEKEHMQVPQTENHLIVELAGGLMVPLNSSYMNIDLVKELNLPVILVSKYYLGSINHTLLSIELLKQRQIPIAGIIFNGEENPDSKTVILAYTQVPLLGEVNQEEVIDQAFIKKYALMLKDNI